MRFYTYTKESSNEYLPSVFHFTQIMTKVPDLFFMRSIFLIVVIILDMKPDKCKYTFVKG